MFENMNIWQHKGSKLIRKNTRLMTSFGIFFLCVETDGQTDMARSTRLVMLFKNIYSLCGRKRSLRCKLLTEIIIPSARV